MQHVSFIARDLLALLMCSVVFLFCFFFFVKRKLANVNTVRDENCLQGQKKNNCISYTRDSSPMPEEQIANTWHQIHVSNTGKCSGLESVGDSVVSRQNKDSLCFLSFHGLNWFWAWYIGRRLLENTSKRITEIFKFYLMAAKLKNLCSPRFQQN